MQESTTLIHWLLIRDIHRINKLWRSPVGTIVLQFLLAAGKRVVGLAAVEPGHGAADPVQQLLVYNALL